MRPCPQEASSRWINCKVNEDRIMEIRNKNLPGRRKRFPGVTGHRVGYRLALQAQEVLWS
jgi:hypothetical protein